MTQTQRVEVGGKVIIATTTTEVEVAEKAVTFQSILDSFELEPDPDHGPPWEDCDGWDHEFLSSENMWHVPDSELRKAQGWVYSDHHRRNGILRFKESAGLPDFKYYHRQGASKQVARELEAQSLRRNLETLVKWYRVGWEYWGVVSNFKHGGKEYHESCWGIDDEDYAMKEVAPDLAGQIAARLENDGFTVTGKPDRKTDYIKNRIAEYKRRMNQFVVERR